MTSLSLAGVYCARTLLGRRVCKRVDVYIITLSCTWQIYALSERLLVIVCVFAIVLLQMTSITVRGPTPSCFRCGASLPMTSSVTPLFTSGCRSTSRRAPRATRSSISVSGSATRRRRASGGSSVDGRTRCARRSACRCACSTPWAVASS